MLKRTVPVLTFAVALSVSNAGYALDDDETEVELSGTIASVDCPSSLITVETASGLITVKTTDEDGEAAEIDGYRQRGDLRRSGRRKQGRCERRL